VRVPAADRLGAEGEGLALALRTLELMRPTVGAAACGMAARALDAARAHVRERRRGGAPLADHESVQMKLAELATDLEAARLLVYRAAWLRETTASATRLDAEASMAKLFATEAAGRIVDAALQLHGGAGVVRGAVVERLYREVRALRIYEGTSEIQKLIIGRALG
jgi:acyl-CoA dehydrogenase